MYSKNIHKGTINLDILLDLLAIKRELKKGF